MRLVRYGDAGKEKPGIVDAQGGIRDASGAVKDIDGAALSPEGLAKLRGLNVESLPKVSGSPRLGPPVANVAKLLASLRSALPHPNRCNDSRSDPSFVASIPKYCVAGVYVALSNPGVSCFHICAMVVPYRLTSWPQALADIRVASRAT